MIKAIADELAVELAAKGCPLPVIYGPEPRTTTVVNRSRIILERDREQGDTFQAPRSQARNPRSSGMRAVSAIMRIYAQSTVDGANLYDHERLADAALDISFTALRKIISTRKTLWNPGRAKFLTVEELQLRGLEQQGGVVFELRFTVDRAVFDTTWAGAAPTEIAAPIITSHTDVRIDENDATPEVSCGA